VLLCVHIRPEESLASALRRAAATDVPVGDAPGGLLGWTFSCGGRAVRNGYGPGLESYGAAGLALCGRLIGGMQTAAGGIAAGAGEGALMLATARQTRSRLATCISSVRGLQGLVDRLGRDLLQAEAGGAPKLPVVVEACGAVRSRPLGNEVPQLDGIKRTTFGSRDTIQGEPHGDKLGSEAGSSPPVKSAAQETASADYETKILQAIQEKAAARDRPPGSVDLDFGYLNTIVRTLDELKKSMDADGREIEAVSKQQETFQRLKNATAIRLDHDRYLINPLPGKGDDKEKISRVNFDQTVDDDEVLLRLFQEIDSDQNGEIDLDELLTSELLKRPENVEMAKVLWRAVGCDLEALEEALAPVTLDGFGIFKRDTKQDSVQAVLDAAMGTRTAPADSSTKAKVASRSDLKRLVQSLDSGEQALKDAISDLEMLLLAEGKLNFMGLKAAVCRVPRVSGQRTAWAQTLGMDAALVRHLPPGTLDDGLDGLKRMEAADLRKALDAFCADVRLMVLTAVKEVQEATGSTSAVEANSKFEGFTGDFASLEDYNRGAEETLKLGYPNPSIDEGIFNEHMRHPSAERLYVTPNYLVVTCLKIEYWFVKDPDNPPSEVKKMLDVCRARPRRKRA
jgi:hypothetical protein